MKRFISLILAICMLTLLCACTKSEEKTEIKIGIAAPDVTHGWVAGVAYYAEKYCKENNVKYKIVTTSDAAEMASGLEDLVAWGASAIVMFPQWEGMDTTVSEIIERGVPVVIFDHDIPVEGIYKVTGDNYGMGYASAKYIVEKVGDGATIAVMDVPSSGSVCGLRKQGFYDYLSEIGYDTSNIFEIACASFAREDGLKNMSDILLTHNTIDAVFSMDDETSIGCIQAITEANRTDIKAITGGGGMQEYFKMIADENYNSLAPASALYSPIMIQDAIKNALAICKGETVEMVTIISTTVVSSENVSEFLDSENTVY